MERVRKIFESKTLVIISTVMFVFSLALLITKQFVEINISPYLDPALFVVLISGYPIVHEAIESLIHDKKITSELLVTIAIIASLFIGDVFAAGEVAFIMTLGEILENKTIQKAKKGLNELINMKPKLAHRGLEDIPVEKIQIGDILKVLPGEEMPIDGIVVSGSSYVDQKILTGESVPVEVYKDSKVFAGTINTNGCIEIKATSTFDSTSLNKMIELLKEAESHEAPMKRIADKWASILVPVSCLIALVTGIVTYFILGNENNIALIRGITVIVVFCPCALSLATPTSIVAAIGQATKNGVIIKSGEALEKMGSTSVVFFDKTGTLTEGKLVVSDVISVSNFSENEIIKIAASIEQNSEHPLSLAIIEKSKELKEKLYEIKDFENVVGKGVSAIVNNIKYYCGNEKHNNIILKHSVNLDDFRNNGKVLIYLSNDEEIIGIIALIDKIRDEAKYTVECLKRQGIIPILLTGDNDVTAKAVASEVGIDKIHANLLPIDKVNIINEYKKNGYNTVMIGDGVNDAPSMATADNGIALSKIGSDITKEASTINLIFDDITKIPYVTKLGKVTVKTIKFNITLSLIINLVAITLSVLGLLNPTTGAIVHNVGSVLVVLNAALLYDKKI